MALASYNDLLAAVANRMNRSDLAALIPEFVSCAEAEFNRVLRLPFQYTPDALLSVSSRYTNLPADFLQMDRVFWIDNTRRRPLQYAGIDYRTHDDGTDTSNRPAEYAIKGAQIEIIPAPTVSLSLRISYWAKIPALLGEVNKLFASHPDLYLYRACYEAAVYMMDQERMTFYLGLYDRLMTEVKEIERNSQKRTPQSLRTDVPWGAGGGFNIYTG